MILIYVSQAKAVHSDQEDPQFARFLWLSAWAEERRSRQNRGPFFDFGAKIVQHDPIIAKNVKHVIPTNVDFNLNFNPSSLL